VPDASAGVTEKIEPSHFPTRWLRNSNLKFKLTIYKMADFKDGIPIMYQLFL
jgi:hypothetical protein